MQLNLLFAEGCHVWIGPVTINQLGFHRGNERGWFNVSTGEIDKRVKVCKPIPRSRHRGIHARLFIDLHREGRVDLLGSLDQNLVKGNRIAGLEHRLHDCLAESTANYHRDNADYECEALFHVVLDRTSSSVSRNSPRASAGLLGTGHGGLRETRPLN